MPRGARDVRVDSQSSGAGLSPGRINDRLLYLADSGSRLRATTVVATFDGPDSSVDGARRIVHTALTASPAVAGGTMFDAPAMDALLEDLTAFPGLNACIALWTRSGILLGTVGGGQIFRCTESSITIVAGGSTGATGRLPAGDRSVLLCLAAPMDGRMGEIEVRQGMVGSVMPGEYADWFSTMSATRSHASATAAIVQDAGGVSPEAAWNRDRTGLDWPLRYVALGVVAALIAVIAAFFVLQPRLPGHSHAIAVDPPPLNGLRSQVTAADAVQLAWNPVAGATGYRVSVGHETFNSPTPVLTITNRLVPGHSYTWQVEALTPGGRSVSTPATLLIPVPTPSLPSLLLARHPIGIMRSRSTSAVLNFCWSGGSGGSTYDLYVVGPKQHLHRLVTAAGTHAVSDIRCLGLPVNARGGYAWRVGARNAAGRETWGAWTYFTLMPLRSRVVPRATAVPRATPVPSPAVAIQVTAPPVIPTASLPTAIIFPTEVPTTPPVFVPPPAPAPVVAPQPTVPAAQPTSGVVQSCPTPPNCS